MTWVEFTKKIPDDDSMVIADVRIPHEVIESWEKYLESKKVKTKIESKDGCRILYKWEKETNG